MAVTQGWRLSLLLLGRLLMLAPAAARPLPPAPEQLLQAAVRADDLAMAGPGGWWNDLPEFNDRLDPGAGAGAVTSVTAHVFGKPDDAPAEVATTLQLYASAAAAAAAFDATAGDDARDDGTPVDGPGIGDESRYLHQPASSEHEGTSALRFRWGGYTARIEAAGAASAMARDQMAALGQMVLVRLRQLEAGTLGVPALPGLARDLPPADPAFGQVLGTAALSREALSWIWSKESSALAVSGPLRVLLKEGAGDGQPLLRRYGLAASPAHVADLVVMPFRDAAAAGRFLLELRREDARRAAGANDEGAVEPAAPIPDVAPAWRADLRVGRYIVEVSCVAPFAPTSTLCAAAAKDLAARAKASLPQK